MLIFSQSFPKLLPKSNTLAKTTRGLAAITNRKNHILIKRIIARAIRGKNNHIATHALIIVSPIPLLTDSLATVISERFAKSIIEA
ncbi:TPA: hypothetical protein DEP21_03960 [Patescibacteria group bacterium]|nr:hypothetical protein [Candidatus Gracilibacteria bacterium]